MRVRVGVLLLCLSTPAIAPAQEILRGRITSASNGAPVAGASVATTGNGGAGTLTAADGRFALRVRALPVRLLVSRLGFASDTILANTATIDLALRDAALTVDPLVVAGERGYSVASSGVLRALDLQLRPRESAQQLLALVPGLVIAQHAGGGKAEQIFLRGFDADHGTDVAITVDGIPVNVPSHAHGQGYADLHFLMPEVVERVDVRKGPYDVRDGDFATAGALTFRTRDRVDGARFSARAGSFGARQLLAMAALPSNADVGVVAGSFATARGPFDAAQDYRRGNGFAKWGTALPAGDLVLSAFAFGSRWDASGQIPLRALPDLGRFGAVDSTEGGHTSRVDVTALLRSRGGSLDRYEAAVFATRYDFRLRSNFTFFLRDSVNGDGIEQVDRRNVLGGRVNIERAHDFLGLPGTWAAGSELRADFADVSLGTQVAGQRLGWLNRDRIRQTHASGWLRRDLQLGSRLRVQAGVRTDLFRFGAHDLLADADAARTLAIVSPRISIASEVASHTTAFLNAGSGFHSNDARDVVRAAPGERVLPRALGAEAGLRRSWSGGSIGAAAWLLDLESELVFVGDEGVTEPSGRTRRLGIDLEARQRLTRWLWADVDLNLARGRFRDEPAGQDLVPLAPSFMSTGGLLAKGAGPWTGGLRYRAIASRPADETGEVRARHSHVWELSAGWERGPLRASLALDNLFDATWNEAQFATTSRLRGEASPVTELHFTPGAPRGFTIALEYRFR